MSKRYNGWANYETWRVNLEYFDADDWERFEDTVQDLYDDYDPPTWAPLESPQEDRERSIRIELAEHLEDEVEQWIESYMPEDACYDVMKGWIHAFIADVRWTEIAAHALNDIKERIDIPELA